MTNEALQFLSSNWDLFFSRNAARYSMGFGGLKEETNLQRRHFRQSETRKFNIFTHEHMSSRRLQVTAVHGSTSGSLSGKPTWTRFNAANTSTTLPPPIRAPLNKKQEAVAQHGITNYC